MRHPLSADRRRGLLPAGRGLETAEVAERRQRFGPNDIVEAPGHPGAELARETARDPMIWFLVGTSVLYAVLGEVTEAITLAASIVPLVALDAYLHRRTQASTRRLRGLLADSARLVRDGAEVTVPATEVVVGDLAIVTTGEPFPADGIVVAGSELSADESALTGEAYPVPKQPMRELPAAEEALVDGVHWSFAGTRLLTGRAEMRVIAVGGETLYGEIVRLAGASGHERTPLQVLVARLVTGLLTAAAILCGILAATRMLQGHGWADALVSAATLAVAALPEEFPVVLTVFLGVGVYRLARRKALVRRAVAVENVGRVSTICSDKTGTITEGRLRVARVASGAGLSEAQVLAIAAAASRRESGDPLDRAILDAAGEAPPGRTIATFPFTESRRRETAIQRRGSGTVACAKGAPEVVLALCAGDQHESWTARTAELAEAGYKVIGCASRVAAPGDQEGAEPDAGFTFAGLIAIADPVRDGVADSVAWCRAAGVRVLMVTGDHPRTARAVARTMGLAGDPVVVTGDDLAAATDLGNAIGGADVIARALPAQKLAVVRSLQAAGEVVAVTGDGVNDVPALQAADVGIAMGQRGARSAREVSAIVLLDDDFRSIVAAIREGRGLFGNLQLSFQYLLMIHLPLVLTATFVPVLGHAILYRPIHMVWLEALIHPTALLAFQLPEGPVGPPQARARGRDARLFSAGQWALVLAVGMLVTSMVAIAFARGLATGDQARARSLALATLTLASAGMAVGLSGLATRTARVVAATSLLSSIAFVQVPPLADLFELRPLAPADWLLAIAGGVVALAPIALTRAARR